MFGLTNGCGDLNYQNLIQYKSVKDFSDELSELLTKRKFKEADSYVAQTRDEIRRSDATILLKQILRYHTIRGSILHCAITKERIYFKDEKNYDSLVSAFKLYVKAESDKDIDRILNYIQDPKLGYPKHVKEDIGTIVEAQKEAKDSVDKLCKEINTSQITKDSDIDLLTKNIVTNWLPNHLLNNETFKKLSHKQGIDDLLRLLELMRSQQTQHISDVYLKSCNCIAKFNRDTSTYILKYVLSEFYRILSQNDSLASIHLCHRSICEQLELNKNVLKALNLPNEILKTHVVVALGHSNVGDVIGFMSTIANINLPICLLIEKNYSSIQISSLYSAQYDIIVPIEGLNKAVGKWHCQISPLAVGTINIVSLSTDRSLFVSRDYVMNDKWDQFRKAALVPKNCERRNPEIPEIYKIKAQQKLNVFSSPKEMVIVIAPMSNYINSVFKSNEKLIDFWRDTCISLQSKGFTIIENAKDEASCILPSKFLDIPLNEMITFVDSAGYFCGVRSGLCDLLSFCESSKRVVVYPGEITKNDLEVYGFRPVGNAIKDPTQAKNRLISAIYDN